MKLEKIKTYIKIKLQHLPKDLEMQILAENHIIDFKKYSNYIDKKILKGRKKLIKDYREKTKKWH